jgi:phosphatidylinositol alpha-1,6-mannosyltransferase
VQKILIISFNFPPTIGGIETYAKELKQNFKNKEDVDFIHPEKEMSANSLRRGISLISFILKTYSQISKKHYELVQLTSFNLWILGYLYSLKYKNSKILINIWGLEFVYKNKSGFFPKLYKKIFIGNKALSSKNFHYLVSSNASKELMVKNGFRKSNINLIKLGVSNQQISRKKTKVLSEKYFLFVGRIVERKGLSWFSNNILPYYPDFKLKVVGPIGNQKEFNLSMGDNVDYLGVVTDEKLMELRMKASISIVPNIFLPNEDDFEAFCFVTIESVASGSLVVASNYQGIPEALLNGKLGSLAEPSNIDSWVNLINKNLSYSYKERFEIISERIKILEKELSWKVLFDKTKELYDEIIKNDR